LVPQLTLFCAYQCDLLLLDFKRE